MRAALAAAAVFMLVQPSLCMNLRYYHSTHSFGHHHPFLIQQQEQIQKSQGQEQAQRDRYHHSTYRHHHPFLIQQQEQTQQSQEQVQTQQQQQEQAQQDRYYHSTYRHHHPFLIQQQEQIQQQQQQQQQDPEPPKDAKQLEFYNNPALGDTLVEVSGRTGVGNTAIKVGDAIYGKGAAKEHQDKPTMYKLTLGACLQRKTSILKAIRNDGGLTTIHDFFTKPTDVKFVNKDHPDQPSNQEPNPYATVTKTTYWPDGDYTRITFKERAECVCENAKSAKKHPEWSTLDKFRDWMTKNKPKGGWEDNAYYRGAISGKQTFKFTGSTQKLELDPHNNHPRGSIDLPNNGGRASYEKEKQNVPKEKTLESIPLFDAKVQSKPGDSGAGLYFPWIDYEDNQKKTIVNYFLGILTGATEHDDYTKFTPVWNIDWPNNYHVC